MDINDARKVLDENPKLAKSVEEAVSRRAEADEFREMLVEAGLDADSAEMFAAEYQQRLGLAISDDDVDEDMLRKVAGGGCGKCTEAADCDKKFKYSQYWDMERCSLNHYCDEMSSDPKCTSEFIK